MSEKQNNSTETVEEQDDLTHKNKKTKKNSTKQKEVEQEQTSTEKKDVLTEEEETYKEQLMRLQAEFQNFRKRTDREKMELSEFVKAEFLKRFLPVFDDLHRLDQYIEKAEKPLQDGLNLVFKKLNDFIEAEKVEKIGKVGEDFDPNFHEALLQAPVENEEDDNKIMMVLEHGYKLNDRIIRYAKVQVGQKN
ncbi:MAG: nucleotide exchange factor GrpE [Calditrichaeota bacterium]|nr:nucleotide exchange factor GrpE [Calditrichota bacterium]